MKYLKQFGIILVVSFIGELLAYFIPAPIPAGIYGIVIMFLCLVFKIIPLCAVKDGAHFLIDIMPVMFISPAVGIMEVAGIIKNSWIPYISIIVITTVLVMGVSGKVAELIIRVKQKKEAKS